MVAKFNNYCYCFILFSDAAVTTIRQSVELDYGLDDWVSITAVELRFALQQYFCGSCNLSSNGNRWLFHQE
jgi:hypothetical protein